MLHYKQRLGQPITNDDVNDLTKIEVSNPNLTLLTILQPLPNKDNGNDNNIADNNASANISEKDNDNNLMYPYEGKMTEQIKICQHLKNIMLTKN